MKSTFILSAFLVFTGSMVVAQTTPIEINTRQHTQHTRIAQGKHTGTVTKKEAHLLHKQQKHIRRAECRANADGMVTPKEEKILHHKQKHANRSIHRAKHNSFDRKG